MMNLKKLAAARDSRELKPFPIPEKELCERYEKLFTAAVNDVLRERALTHQTLPHGILPLRETMKVAGPAFTVKGSPSLLIRDEMQDRAAMLESIPAQAVVTWDTSGDNESAQWGEVMTMSAGKRGCRGAVIDGGVRDTDRVLSQNFPVFVKYRTSNGMLGRFRVTGWQIPIRIGEVDIHSGDIIFGDTDGVIVVPRDMAYDVLIRAEEIANHEGQLKQWVQEGLPATEIVKRGGYF